jgi:phosphate starvation-inducible membrane PsiE
MANLTAPKPAVIQEQIIKFSQMRVEEILQLHKRNFQISYSDIVRIKMRNETTQGLKTGTLTVTTLKEATFEIPPYQDFQACAEIARNVLSNKLDGGNIPVQPQQDTIVISNEIPMGESNVKWGNAVQNAKFPTVTGATLQTKDERQVRSSSNWFYIIAGFSVLNCLIYYAGSNITFLVGLGTTQLITAYAKLIDSSLMPLAVVLTILTAGAFAALGAFARKQNTWAFITGLVIYALDCLIFIWVKDWLSVGFHVFALWMIFIGTTACLRLNKAKQTAADRQ